MSWFRKRKQKSLSIEGIADYLNKLITLCQRILSHIDAILGKRSNLTEDFLRVYSEKIRDPVYFREITSPSPEFTNLKKEEDDISKLLVLEGLLEHDLMRLSNQFELDKGRFLDWRHFIEMQYPNPDNQQSQTLSAIKGEIAVFADENGQIDGIMVVIGRCFIAGRDTTKTEDILKDLLDYDNVVRLLDSHRIKKWQARTKMEVGSLKQHLEAENKLIENLKLRLDKYSDDLAVLISLLASLRENGSAPLTATPTEPVSPSPGSAPPTNFFFNTTHFFNELFEALRSESFDDAERIIRTAISQVDTPQRILDVFELAFLRGLILVQIKNHQFEQAIASLNSEEVKHFDFGDRRVREELIEIIEELKRKYPATETLEYRLELKPLNSQPSRPIIILSQFHKLGEDSVKIGNRSDCDIILLNAENRILIHAVIGFDDAESKFIILNTWVPEGIEIIKSTNYISLRYGYQIPLDEMDKIEIYGYRFEAHIVKVPQEEIDKTLYERNLRTELRLNRD